MQKRRSWKAYYIYYMCVSVYQKRLVRHYITMYYHVIMLYRYNIFLCFSWKTWKHLLMLNISSFLNIINCVWLPLSSLFSYYFFLLTGHYRKVAKFMMEQLCTETTHLHQLVLRINMCMEGVGAQYPTIALQWSYILMLLNYNDQTWWRHTLRTPADSSEDCSW